MKYHPKYKAQIHTLLKVNNTHIQKQENEIAKLTNKKNNLIIELEQKEKEISVLNDEKNKFRNNYFKSLTGKTFATGQFNFFKNTLEAFETRLSELRTQKEKIQKKIDDVETNIKKHRKALKTYSFKNEKYDYLKASFGLHFPLATR